MKKLLLLVGVALAMVAGTTAVVVSQNKISVSRAAGYTGFDNACLISADNPWNAGWTNWPGVGYATGIGFEVNLGGWSGTPCHNYYKEVGAQLWDDTTGTKVDDTTLSGSGTYGQNASNGNPNTWWDGPGIPNDGYPCQSGHVYQVWAYGWVWSHAGGYWHWVYNQVASGNYAVC